MRGSQPYSAHVLSLEHEAILEAESSQIAAWLTHLVRLETLDPHVLCVVDLRSPLGFEIATAATDEQHTRAHLTVLLERGEVPGFTCVFDVPYCGESEAIRYVAGLINGHVGEMEGSFVGIAAIDEHDSVAMGRTTLDRRTSEWARIEWRAVLPGRAPDPLPRPHDRPW